MNCPSHFPFLKLTRWSKWVFTFFLGDKRSFHYIFYQHHGYAVLYMLQPRLFELIDHWHLQLFPVMQILTAGVGTGHYFQSIHTCLFHPWSQSREQTRYGAIACHKTIWKMTFYQDHLQLWVWVSADSVQVNCPLCPYVLQGVCTAIQIAFFLSFSPHPFLYLSVFLSLTHTHAL